jgi:hypothetical protein
MGLIPVKYEYHAEIKQSKIIPTTGREGLQGCEMSRIPYCLNIRLTEGAVVVSLRHRQCSTPRNTFLCLWYSFLLGAQ